MGAFWWWACRLRFVLWNYNITHSAVLLFLASFSLSQTYHASNRPPMKTIHTVLCSNVLSIGEVYRVLCNAYITCSRTIWSPFRINSTSSMEELAPGTGEWGRGHIRVWKHGNGTHLEEERENWFSWPATCCCRPCVCRQLSIRVENHVHYRSNGLFCIIIHVRTNRTLCQDEVILEYTVSCMSVMYHFSEL